MPTTTVNTGVSQIVHIVPMRKEQAPCCIATRDRMGRLCVGFCGPLCIRRLSWGLATRSVDGPLSAVGDHPGRLGGTRALGRRGSGITDRVPPTSDGGDR